MIIGTGTDLISADRIRKTFSPEKRLSRIFTEAEIALFKNKKGQINWERAAGNFALKESLGKALGTGLGRISFKDMEVLRDKAGKPVASKDTENIIKEHFKEFRNIRIHLSMSHDSGFATGFAVIEGEM